MPKLHCNLCCFLTYMQGRSHLHVSVFNAVKTYRGERWEGGSFLAQKLYLGWIGHSLWITGPPCVPVTPCVVLGAVLLPQKATKTENEALDSTKWPSLSEFTFTNLVWNYSLSSQLPRFRRGNCVQVVTSWVVLWFLVLITSTKTQNEALDSTKWPNYSEFNYTNLVWNYSLLSLTFVKKL